MATIFNPVTFGYIPDRDLTFPRVSVDSVSSDFTKTSDEDGSASGQESTFGKVVIKVILWTVTVLLSIRDLCLAQNRMVEML